LLLVLGLVIPHVAGLEDEVGILPRRRQLLLVDQEGVGVGLLSLVLRHAAEQRGERDDGLHGRPPRSLPYYTGDSAGFSSKRSAFRREGKNPIQARTTATVPTPPTTMARDAPNHLAVRPDSNSPSSFDVLMNTIETALTRPRMASGVATWMRVWRTVTLSMSAAPEITSSAIVRGKFVERPNPIVARPKTATPPNSQAPMRSRSGRIARARAMSPAPSDGALRRMPSTWGPLLKVDLAMRGRSAVAPPRRTAKRSSDMAPRSRRSFQTYLTPAVKARANGSAAGAGAGRARRSAKSRNARMKRPAAVAYTRSGWFAA